MKKIIDQLTIQMIEAQLITALKLKTNTIQKITIVNVFDDHYRCNIYCRDEGKSTISHSYFVTLDDDGNIIKANPALPEIK